jgi:hypothetical protein
MERRRRGAVDAQAFTDTALMSLRFFHIVFIVLSALMALVVGIWAIDAYRTDGSATWAALAVLALGGGALLVVYGNRFLQKTRKLGVVALVAAGTFGLPSELFACAVCLGNTQSSLRDGMTMGILVLIGFASFMIVSFAIFFIYLARKAKAASASAERNPVHA